MPGRRTVTAFSLGQALGAPLAVGIVGCGHVAHKHLAALRAIRQISVVGVCDHDPAAREAAARTSGGRAYDDLSAMLRDQKLDVVHVLTPPQSHCELAVGAMRAGCHVLVEKPLAMTSREVDHIVSVARQASVHLGVCHNFLFEPAVLRALAMLRSGVLGRLIGVDIFWRIHHGGRNDRFRNSDWIRRLPGGVFQEVAPHALYLQSMFLGRPRIVSVLAKRIGGEVVRGIDELRVLLEGDASLGSVAISVHAEPHQASARIYGTEMSLVLDLTTNVIVKLRTKGTGRVAKLTRSADQSWQLLSGTLCNAVKTLTGRMRFGHETLIRTFYANLRNGVEPPVGAAQGRVVVALLEEISAALTATAPARAEA